MPTETKRLVYDDWSGGEFGTMNPAKAPNGTWTGQNCVVYRNGRIGPRPGVREITYTTSLAKVGPMLGFGFSPVAQSGNTPIFFILEDRPYLFLPVSGSNATITAASADLASAPGDSTDTHVLSKESVRLIGDELYFTVNSDKSYRLDCRTQTLTAITGSADESGVDIELYRDRMLTATSGVRVYYSDAADFDTWDSAGGAFFDVGAAYRILAMLEFRDTLVIFTQSGTWVMTGTADDGTLRRISDTLSPMVKTVLKSNDSLTYIPASRNAPVIFNGSFGDEESLAHLEDWKSIDDPAYGVQSYGNRDLLWLDNQGKLLWRKNDAYTFHDVGITGIGPWITRYFDDQVVMANPGTASVDPDFYMLDMTLDRPAFTSDTWAQPGDDSTTPLDAYFSIPDYHSPEGYECRVRSVTIDFYAYDTGSATNNNIDLVITSLLRENVDTTNTVTKTGVYNEDTGERSTTGDSLRRVYRGTPGAFGGGFRLKLDNIVGVAIDRVIVEIEEQQVPVT